VVGAVVHPGQLGARFPGTLAGTIGDAALNGANDLVIYVGYTPRELATVPGTRWVTSIATVPAPEVFTPFFRYAFGVGVLAMLFPMLVLISTATRLAAARREERFAAVRLVGGTPGDIRVIAAVESVVSAFFGAALGIVIFLLARPLLADAAPIGTQYFPSEVTPTVWAYIAMLVGVPVAAALVAIRHAAHPTDPLHARLARFLRSPPNSPAAIARLDRLKAFGLPLLVGASRKSFINAVVASPPDRRLGGSIAAHVLAAERGAALIRTHDVAATVQALRVMAAIETSA